MRVCGRGNRADFSPIDEDPARWVTLSRRFHDVETGFQLRQDRAA